MTDIAIGIDLGTTGVKVLAVSLPDGSVLSESAGEYAAVTAAGGHEQHPEEWWEVTSRCLRQVTSRVQADHIVGVGLSGHMHSLLLLDDDGAPVAPAMTWADRRPGEKALRLAEDSRFLERAGNEAAEAFTAPKLAWFAEQHPQLLTRARHLLLAKDYLGLKLTGRLATDVTDALGTLLWNLHSREWDSELFAACGASAELGAEVLEPGEARGEVTREASALTGLPAGTPVAAGAGDVPAVMAGSGTTDDSAVCLNVGTAAQVMRALHQPDAQPGFLFGAMRESRYLKMASVYAAGASVRWAQSLLGAVRPDSAGLDEVGPGADGLTYLPFMYGMSAPVKNDQMRGAMLGQTDRHGPDQMMAAVIEGVAFACADAVDVVLGGRAEVRSLHLVGGLARSRRFRESLAAVLDVEIRHARRGGSPLGAAMVGAALGGASESLDVAAAADLQRVPVPEGGQRKALEEARARFAAYRQQLTASRR